ncbi:MAG: diguanylate cyclase [Gemmatimonadota bacterium]
MSSGANASGRILIVDDDPLVTRSLTVLLEQHGYHATSLSTAERLIEHLDGHRTDLLILDIGLPGVDGLALLEQIKSHQGHRDLPVLMLSATSLEETSVEALGRGAADFISKPFRPGDLLARIDAHLRAGRELQRARVEALSQVEIADILREVMISLTPAEIFHVLVRRVSRALGISRCSIVLAERDTDMGTVVAACENPSLRHLSIELRRYPELLGPIVTGEALLIRDVHSDPFFAKTRELWRTEGRLVPTTSVAAVPFTLKGGASGALYMRTTGDDHELTPQDVSFASQVVHAAMPLAEKAYDFEEALRRQDEMRQLAETDPLTGLFNRRAFRERLTRELDRAERYNGIVSCLMLDIDHFKILNDTYGHALGDRVLTQLAELLKREQRAMDVLARLGGEEFVVLLPETGMRGARIFAERILRRVSSASFGDVRQPATLTVSIGIGTFPDERINDGDSLLRLADSNLLRAKADGRNRYRD